MTRLAFIGAGNIAQAIIIGLIENGFNPTDIWAADPMEAQLARLEKIGVQVTGDNRDAAINADVVVISVKPDVVESMARTLKAVAADKMFISVAAGITTQSLIAWLGSDRVVRCMPNTPALVQMGMTGLYAADGVSASHRQAAADILATIGEILWFDQESQLDAVTAISGSGPAYFFYIIEVLQRNAMALGLSESASRQLVLQTARGAAEMAWQSDLDAATLRQNVTSAGGTTEAALNILGSGELEAVFSAAIAAAKTRSEQLSGN